MRTCLLDRVPSMKRDENVDESRKKRTAVHENTRFPGRHCPSAKDFLTGVMGCPKRESVVKGVRVVCRHDRCALRYGVVCRKARMASPRRPPAQPAALFLLSQPPLFTFSHFRCFPSRLWRTPRTLSPCTSKYSCRVTLRHLDSQCLAQISCLPRHAG